MQFFRNNWIYIAIAFAVMLLAGIGYITYARLNELTVQDATPALTPTPTEAADTNEVELTFQITPPAGEELSCLELVATPLKGNVPLSVSFSGVAQELTDEEVSFTFDFGDESSQTVETAVTTSDGIVSQDITHTYTEPGEFTALLTVESTSGTVTSESCSIDIAAGGLAQVPIGGPSESTSVAQLLSTDTPVPEDVPVPDIPEAGGFLPTALAALGGLAIILLAFAIL